MDEVEAYPITYGTLGLLALWGPLSGYDLKHLFDHILAPMWGAAQSQIYKELRRMQALGWVDMRREEQESRPDRKIYSITEKGQAALRQWQSQPPGVFQLRDELLLKVFYGAFAAPADLAQHLRASIVEHEMRLLGYRQQALVMPPRKTWQRGKKRPNPYAAENQPEDPYFGLVARFAIAFEQTYVRWLYEALEVVEQLQKPTPEEE
jgi:PadR family transcriptional regulator AphA